MKMPLQPRSQQRGYILLSTIIMVLLITVLALSSVSFNSTQTRIATNSNDAQVAMQTAEGALRQVADNVSVGLVNFCTASTTVAITNGNINTTCVNSADATPLWQVSGTTWFNLLPNGTLFQGSSSTQPTYIVEQLQGVIVPSYSMNVKAFPMRITVKASGAISTTPSVMLQTIIMIPFST